VAFLSPNQIEAGSDIFDRYVMKYNQRLKAVLKAWDVDLFFHCCGELIPYMVKKFCELDPAVLSLGSSRKLWEDAAVVPKDVVLFGNLPTKTFYSDDAMPAQEVRRCTIELHDRMAACGHPLILASECDVLHVPEAAETIRHKVDVMLQAGRESL
jgi:uroporphyrinogen-III decarboxylase